MSKKHLFIGSIIFAVMVIANYTFAADYSSMTTDELAALRGTMMNADSKDREAFRAEWQERVRNMSREERQAYNSGNGSKLKARARMKKMARHRACDGTGSTTGNMVRGTDNGGRGQNRCGNGRS